MQRRRRIAFAIVGVVASISALVACASLVVPDVDVTARPPDAATTDAGPGKDTGTGPVDPCAHVHPPGKLPDSDPTIDVGEMAFVVRETHLEKAFGYDAGAFDGGPAVNVVLGFDLDNGCTCRPDQHPIGTTSCRSVKQVCDQAGGIDNQLPALLAPLKAFMPNTDVDTLATVNHRIAAGDTAIMMVLRGYNGLANDEQVTLVMHGVARPNRLPYAGAGDKCVDAGQRPPSFPPLDDPEAGTYDPARIPLFDGCDAWGDVEATPPIAAYVTNHVLVMITDVAVPVPVAGTIIYAESTKLTAVLVPDGRGSFTLEDGNIGGRGPTTPLLAAGGSLRFSIDAGPICLDNSSGNIPKNLFIATICESVDIASQASEDYFVNAKGAQVNCDALSMGFGFRGERAYVGEPTDASFGSPCADAGLVCPAIDGGAN